MKKKRFFFFMSMTKFDQNSAQNLLDLVFGQLCDALQDVADAMFAGRHEWACNHPAVIANEFDRKTLDGDWRGVCNH